LQIPDGFELEFPENLLLVLEKLVLDQQILVLALALDLQLHFEPGLCPLIVLDFVLLGLHFPFALLFF